MSDEWWICNDCGRRWPDDVRKGGIDSCPRCHSLNVQLEGEVDDDDA